MMIPYGRQDVREDDIARVVEVLRSDFLTQGDAVVQFEQAVCAKTGGKAATATSNATSALHVACAALGLGTGDWLWTVPNTFVASANCGLYCGAKVDFVDIDPVSKNLSPTLLAEKLAQAKQQGRLPKIVIPVHFSGLPCDMEAIWELSREYGFSIIEDASHAIGSEYKGQPTGNCKFSHVAVFSFHPVKIITTGEGGMAVTNDSELDARMKRLRSHGMTRDADDMTHTPDGPWYYQQIELGWNYRLTDIQSALGLSQLQRLDDYIATRNAIADHYDARLCELPLKLPVRLPDRKSSVHLYTVELDESLDRLAVFKELGKRGLGVNVHFIPVHLQPYYRKLGFAPGDFSNAEHHYDKSITLPLHPGLTDEQQAKVVTAVREVCSG